MPSVLVVHHSPTSSVRALTDAVVAGCNDPEIEGVDVVVRKAAEASVDDVLSASGIVLGTSVHFGYMSGMLKDFFDRTFMHVGGDLGQTDPTGTSPSSLVDADRVSSESNFGYMAGALKHFFDSTFLEIGGSLADDGAAGGPGGSGKLPFGLYVHGRYDAEGAVRSVLTIAGALPWRRSAEVLAVLGDVDDADTAAAYELGGTIAALAAG
ncbi:flavodoxin family protein [Nocardioides alkalitolerans]|uniref:flavodoxin family protein n=1 Tax=Nocardioides alkalitolerans TaxID=281714 RepID=UPI00048F666B|nr:NAD(P)H-dependent oxidoreductase [Nocardioides alkalitolerans]